jgi:hypothetical protein
MWPSGWNQGEQIVPKKVEAKKEKSEFKFCVKCIGYAIVDVMVMFHGLIKKLL